VQDKLEFIAAFIGKALMQHHSTGHHGEYDQDGDEIYRLRAGGIDALCGE
jgi:hypothetical protein